MKIIGKILFFLGFFGIFGFIDIMMHDFIFEAKIIYIILVIASFISSFLLYLRNFGPYNGLIDITQIILNIIVPLGAIGCAVYLTSKHGAAHIFLTIMNFLAGYFIGSVIGFFVIMLYQKIKRNI